MESSGWLSFLPINCFNPWCTCLNNYCLFCQGKSVLCISIQNSAGSHQTVGLEEGTRYPTLYYLHYHICWYLAWLAWQLVQVFTCIIHWLNSGFHCERLNANYVLYMHCILLIVWADGDWWTKSWKHSSMQWHPCKQVTASWYACLTYFCCFR